MISIRATEEEYEHICEASAKLGFRSVSEFVRAALIGWVRRFQSGREKDAEAVECLCSRLDDLETRVVQIEADRGRIAHQ